MTVTLYILTTKGPVRIQRIAEEAPAVQSVICLDGRAQALPISSRYDAFVRNPTGVIERATGHGAYRMDVDQMIDDGDSWQLGVCLAHFSQHATDDDLHIFATGEVDRELIVRPVSHVPEKLEQAADLIRVLVDEGKRVRIFVPQQDDALVSQAAGVEIDQVTHVDQVFGRLGIAPPKPEVFEKSAYDQQSNDKEIWQPRLIWTLPVLLIVGWFLWTPISWIGLASDGKLLELEEAIDKAATTFLGGYQQDLFLLIRDFRSPDPSAPELTGTLTAAANSKNCMTKSDIQSYLWDEPISASNSICELVVQANARATGGIIAGRMGYWPDGLGKGNTPERTMRGSKSAAGHRWSLGFEKFPTPKAVVRLVILKGLTVPSGSQPWYATLLRAPIDSADFVAAKARVERLGYHVFVHDWRRR